VSAQASTRFDNSLRYRDGDHPSQTALTPAYVLERVRADLGGHIGLDPCTTPENPCDALAYYTPASDGLAHPWNMPRIFVNPPYGKAREPWVDRCIEAAERGHRVILLMPAATDTRVFQRAASTAQSVVFIKGRVKFGVLRPNRRQVAASHPSALLGWNVELEACSELGLSLASRETSE
jgi:DNA N-6-adenine-methyltransferase (Dam)